MKAIIEDTNHPSPPLPNHTPYDPAGRPKVAISQQPASLHHSNNPVTGNHNNSIRQRHAQPMTKAHNPLTTATSPNNNSNTKPNSSNSHANLPFYPAESKQVVTFTNPQYMGDDGEIDSPNITSCCVQDNTCSSDDFSSFIQRLNNPDAFNNTNNVNSNNLYDSYPQQIPQPPPNYNNHRLPSFESTPSSQFNPPPPDYGDTRCQECIALGVIDDHDLDIGNDLDSECESTQSTGSTSLGANQSGKLSPWAASLKRSPSYTSAVGGSFGSDIDKESKQPNVNKCRHFAGKTYMGVSGDSL